MNQDDEIKQMRRERERRRRASMMRAHEKERFPWLKTLTVIVGIISIVYFVSVIIDLSSDADSYSLNRFSTQSSSQSSSSHTAFFIPLLTLNITLMLLNLNKNKAAQDDDGPPPSSESVKAFQKRAKDRARAKIDKEDSRPINWD